MLRELNHQVNLNILMIYFTFDFDVGEGGASCLKIHKQTSIKYSEPVSQKQMLSWL